MKSKKTSLFKKSIFLTLILFLALILGWQVSADAKTVIFGDNTGDDFPGTVEDALIWQRSGEVNYNYGSKTTNPVGERGTLGKTRRSLIRFKDIASNIGAGKSIISATMYLYCNGEDSDTDHSISAYRVLKDWVEGTQDGLIEDGSSCWNYAQHTGLPWISAGCSVASDVTGEDSTADRRATAEDSTLITGTGWFSWDLTTAVQNWYSGGWSEYGVILINDDEDTPNCRKIFLSSENATDGQLPYLEVTYTVLSVYPPTLDWTGDTGYTTDGVEPDTGDSGSTFEFRVEYTDQDNDAPTIREVWIDLDDSGTYEYAEKFPMTRLAGTDYTQGVDYTKSKTIGYVGDGILNYSFYFNDGTDDAIEYDPVSDHTFTVTTERIIDESFEGNGDGYEETWTPTVGDGCTLNPDYLHSDIPGTPTPPSGAGSECLKLVSESTGWEAYATRDYGLEEPKTFTRMYLYVDDEDLIDGNNKRIALAEDGSGGNVFMLDLNKNGTNLRLRLRLYNDGGWSNYPRKISLDTWYRVEVKYDYDGKSWEWRIDGVREDSGSLTGTHRTGIQKWTCGFWSATQICTGTIYFDLVTVDTKYWVEPRVETTHYVDKDNTGGAEAPYITKETAATSIQDAINACSGGTRGIVYVRQAPLNESIFMKSEVDVIGVDEWWNPTDPDDPRDGPIINDDHPVDIQASNCILEGFTIRGGSDGDALIYVNGATYAVENATIRDCWLSEAVGPGIILNGPVSPIIEKCDIDRADAGGIVVWLGTNYIFSTGSPIVIRDCRIYGCMVGIRSNSSIATGQNIKMTIEGNHIYENDFAGIRLSNFLSGSYVTIDNNEISNNALSVSNQGAGIRIENVALVTIKNNDIHDHAIHAGISIEGNSNVTIGENNDIYNNYGGIVFRSANTEPVTIKGNYIHSNIRGGIYVHENISGSLVGQVTVTENEIAQNTRAGIGINNTCNMVITKNNIHDSSNRGGIHTHGGSPTLTIRQNKIHDNQGANRGGGIDVRHASGTIENKLIYKNARGGIRIGENITDVINNTVVWNGFNNTYGAGIVYDDRTTGAINDPADRVYTDVTLPYIRNNICAYNKKAGIGVVFDNTGGERDYNLLYDNWYGYGYGDCSHTGWPGCKKRQLGGSWPVAPNEIFGDPYFVDMNSDNYHLDPGPPSPAIGAGDDLTDMGCYGGDYPIVDSEIP